MKGVYVCVSSSFSSHFSKQEISTFFSVILNKKKVFLQNVIPIQSCGTVTAMPSGVLRVEERTFVLQEW